MALLSAKISKGTGARHRVRRRRLSLILTHTHSYPLAQGQLQLIAPCPWLKCQVHIWRHESFPMTGSGKMLKHETLGDSWPLATGHWPLALALATPWKSRCQWPLPRCPVAPLPLSLNLEALPALPALPAPRGSEPSRLSRARRIRRLTSTLPPRKQQSDSQNCCYF